MKKSPHWDLYRKKRKTPQAAAALVEEGANVVFGMTTGEPPALLAALADRLRGGGLAALNAFIMLPCEHSLKTILAPDLADQVNANTWFVSAGDRNRVRVGLSYFIPNEFHQLPRLIRDHLRVDVAMTTVSPMDKSGYFTFGAVNDYISTAARCAKKLIVEVNPNMPRVFGDSLLHISEVDALVEHEAPLMEIAPTPPRQEAGAIARLIAQEIPDRACIQLGFGGIPNAVCDCLGNHKDLGLHTELFCPGMVDLIQKGVITGARKNLHPRKHIITNALGDRALYDFIDDNPSVESHPVSVTNDPVNIGANDNLISINATLEVDLLGQCDSETLAGRQFSGTGGQLDFVRGAYRSRGGKSFIAFYSTAKNGTLSRIVPRLASGEVVTTPRMEVQYLVTEFGVVNLKGKSSRDRALAIISLAHPDFRENLLKEAEDMYLL